MRRPLPLWPPLPSTLPLGRRPAAARLLVGAFALAILAVANPANPADDAMAEPLTATPGDPVRGRAIVTDRQLGLCLLCHRAPVPEEPFQGDLAPNLAGVGSRLSTGQLRLRLVDARRTNPDSIMPAYHRTEGLRRVAPAHRDRPLLTAQQLEDVVAWLATLR